MAGVLLSPLPLFPFASLLENLITIPENSLLRQSRCGGSISVLTELEQSELWSEVSHFKVHSTLVSCTKNHSPRPCLLAIPAKPAFSRPQSRTVVKRACEWRRLRRRLVSSAIVVNSVYLQAPGAGVERPQPFRARPLVSHMTCAPIARLHRPLYTLRSCHLCHWTSLPDESAANSKSATLFNLHDCQYHSVSAPV